MLAFPNRILFVGFGAVARCTLPILLKHIRVDPKHVTIMDFEPNEAGSEALDRAGHDFRQGSRDAGKPGHAAGPARLGRRPPHRPGVEHRLLRNRPVVPRPGRALCQHVGGALGPLRRGGRQAPDRADTLLAAHEPAADDRAVERAGADSGARTRGKPGPDQPFHQACSFGHRSAGPGGQEVQRRSGGEDRAPRQGAGASTTSPTSSASRSFIAASATRRSPISPNR